MSGYNMTEEERKAEFLKQALKIQEVVKSGYAGILQNGNIVDRREHPNAIPMQKNTLLGVPEPLPVKK